MGYGTQTAYFSFAIILILILYYISSQIKKKNKCPVIPDKCTTEIGVYEGDSIIATQPLNQLYIKTAYNCCCRGKFRNHYVDLVNGDADDYCALRNCALNGVRALDFTIFSINQKAVISASTTSENTYKELYNHLDFNSTMQKVKQYFLTDSNTSKTSDPLFLILRIQSAIPDLYNSIAYTLIQTFGLGNSSVNLLMTQRINSYTALKSTNNSIQNFKVIVFVETGYSDIYDKSELAKIAAYRFHADRNTIPYIYRYSDNKTNYSNDINIIYPDLQVVSSSNFDPTNAFTTGITFIGMNFQNQDDNLKKYNKMFGNRSIISKTSSYNTTTIVTSPPISTGVTTTSAPTSQSVITTSAPTSQNVTTTSAPTPTSAPTSQNVTTTSAPTSQNVTTTSGGV